MMGSTLLAKRIFLSVFVTFSDSARCSFDKSGLVLKDVQVQTPPQWVSFPAIEVPWSALLGGPMVRPRGFPGVVVFSLGQARVLPSGQERPIDRSFVPRSKMALPPSSDFTVYLNIARLNSLSLRHG